MGSFADRRKQAEKDGLLGKGDYLKLKEGANRLRLVSECLPHPGEYQGKPNFKWLCYVLDRADGIIKPMFMAHTIYKQIESLQASEDYAFDDAPMPYDVTVNAKSAGTINAEYTVVPARANKPLTAAEDTALKAMKSIEELRLALKKEKQDKTHPATERPGEDESYDPHSEPVDDHNTPF